MRRLSSCGIAAWLLTVAAAVQAQVPSGPGEWPQWRGPNRDGISHEKGLLKQWPEEGPKVLWQIDSVGTGYSSLAVKDGRIFTQGDIDGVEHILAIDANTGRTLWAVQPSPVAAGSGSPQPSASRHASPPDVIRAAAREPGQMPTAWIIRGTAVRGGRSSVTEAPPL